VEAAQARGEGHIGVVAGGALRPDR
jgi:methylmalonyl-CoA mutase cobalamin-binding subunit